MTVADALTAVALTSLDERDSRYLRAATLTNVAAGLGDLGASAELIKSVRAGMGGTPASNAVGLAMQLHARTQDDFIPHGRSHVGAVTLATALALAEDVGNRLLDCLAVGYRAMMAVAQCYSADAQRRRYRPTGFFGPFGSTGVAAGALELTAQQTANALGLACALTAGTNQSWISGSDEWLIEVGMAARSGVDAAGLTAAGAAAAPDAFEGQAGWSTAFFDDPGASRLTDALGASFTLADSVAVKPYPVSGIAQPMTWLAARAHHRLAGRGFQRAVVHISAAESDYPGSMNRGPFDARGQALMSVAYCVACALSAGYVQVRQLEDPESVAALIDRVEIVPDAGLAELDATVTVLADDGEEIVLKDNGRELLFLDPDTVDPAEIARRSEAPVSAVERAWQELTRDQPDARVLAEIVGAA